MDSKEEELEAKIGKEELEKRVKAKIEEFSGLITRQLAIEALHKEVFGERKGMDIEGVLEALGDEEEFNGKPRRIAFIREGEKRVEMAFWGELAVALRRILIGSRIRVTKCYEKYGIINTGFNSQLEVLQKVVPVEDYSELKEGRINIKGLVFEMQGVRERQDGREMGEFALTDGRKKVRCIVWDGVDRVEKLRPGDIVLIEGAEVREGEVHIGRGTRFLVKKKKL
ncbi:MAG: hypothetical protein QW035_04670 [Candidatus Anstonellales archaeon]